MGPGALTRRLRALFDGRAEPAPDALVGQALEHHGRGETDAAMALLRRAIAMSPRHGEANFVLGLLLQDAGDASALDHLRVAAEADPASAERRFAAGEAARRFDGLADAIEWFRTGLAIDPSTASRWGQFGDLLLAAGRPSGAMAAAGEALARAPDDPQAWHLRGVCLRALGRSAEAADIFERIAEREDGFGDGARSLLLTSHYSDRIGSTRIFDLHRRFAARLSPCDEHGDPGAPWSVDAAALRGERRMRVGFVSPDFGQHVVSFFMEPLFRALDRAGVAVFAYDTRQRGDDQTRLMRGLVEHWRDVAAADDDQLTDLIRNDALDIAVDLSGHTSGHRLAAFARRVAPVQATWLGYPATTGVPAMDYRITDSLCDPEGIPDEVHTERLWRIGVPFLAYGPRLDAPAAARAGGADTRAVAFGCFANFAKVTDTTLGLWAGILDRLPEARLVLKSRGLDEPETAGALRERFGRLGGDAERVVLRGFVGGLHDHLACYADVDIALDTFPYHGTTTTCEALWMGVPVVTLAGDRHASRVGVSLLTAIGCEEWVTRTGDAYVETAVRLARDPGRLSGHELRERVAASPLREEAAFARRFEAALRAMLAETSARRGAVTGRD